MQKAMNRLISLQTSGSVYLKADRLGKGSQNLCQTLDSSNHAKIGPLDSLYMPGQTYKVTKSQSQMQLALQDLATGS